VQRSLSSNYPEKLVLGDYTKDSSPILSTLSLTDHRGGIGLDVMTGDGDTDRSWYSTADTRFKGHLILPPLVTATSNLPAGATQFGAMVGFGGAIYASIYTAAGATDGVYKYDDSGTTWGARVLAPGAGGAIQYSAVAGRIGTSQFVVFGDGQNYYYSTDGSSWSTGGVGTNRVFSLAIWDGKLWMLGTAELSYVTAPGATVISAGLTPRTGKTRGLFVGRDAQGEETLYMVATDGLWAYDFDNNTFIQTAVNIPDKSTGVTDTYGAGTRWREGHYFSAECSLLEYILGSAGGLVTTVGPDRDHGLPSGYGTLISNLQGSLNELVVALCGTGTQKALMLGWNGKGWRVLTELGASENFSDTYRVGYMGMLVAGAYGDYRVWFSSDEGDYVKYLKLPADIVNPLQVSTYAYAAAAQHDWPWFTAGQSEVSKVGVRVKVETVNPSATQTVKISYAINQSATFTILTNAAFPDGLIDPTDGGGVYTFTLPSANTWASTPATGLEFRQIRFRADLATNTSTSTPQVLALTLEYYKKLDPKYQFQVTLDLTKGVKGNTPKQLRAKLLTAQETATLVEFTYRDPVSNTDATFYVQVRPQVSSEETGFDERGKSQLLLVEV